jgi:hypothetical protein
LIDSIDSVTLILVVPLLFSSFIPVGNLTSTMRGIILIKPEDNGEKDTVRRVF